ncbi:MAG: nitroreductase family protein [Candidatus Thorarchaeota archaeon]
MSVSNTIKSRRSFRALEKIEITRDLITDLAENAQLSASCFNYQPWNFVFVYENEMLEKIFTSLSSNNKWAHKASMIIAVFSRKDLDCIIGAEREYYLFDTGMATAFMILRGTELGLVLHPIAGYDQLKVKEILGIPDQMTVITLLIVGKKSDKTLDLTEKQIVTENIRPPRKALDQFVYFNKYSKEQ